MHAYRMGSIRGIDWMEGNMVPALLGFLGSLCEKRGGYSPDRSLSDLLPVRGKLLHPAIKVYVAAIFPRRVKFGEKSWGGWFVLCGVITMRWTQTLTHLYDYNPPLDMPSSSSVKADSNDVELSRCEVLPAIPLPSEVWSGPAVQPRLLFSPSVLSALIRLRLYHYWHHQLLHCIIIAGNSIHVDCEGICSLGLWLPLKRYRSLKHVVWNTSMLVLISLFLEIWHFMGSKSLITASSLLHYKMYF